MRKIAVLVVMAALVGAEGMGKAWLNLGYATVSQEYDSTGEAQDYPADGSSSILNLRLGGKYNLPLQLPVGLGIGGNLGLSQQSYSDTTGDMSSGFALQYFSPFLLVSGPYVGGILGFQLDLGPEPEYDTLGRLTNLPNTDEQNALFVGAWGNFDTPMFGLFGGLSYIFTMEGSTNGTTYDQGDHIIVKAGGSYKFGIGNVGLALLYRLRTDASSAGTTISGSGGNHLSLYPFINLSPPALPVKFSLKFAVDDEYYDYGLSLMGNDSPVTRLGVTLGASYSF